jgi:UPF0716 protein FxsA
VVTVPIFFVLFVVLPLTELWLLIKIGGALGGWLTVLWVIATGVLGVSVLKRQGLEMLWGVNRKMLDGELQAAELAQGVLLALAGLLLLVPGVITDCFGFALLSPHIRQLCARQILRRMSVHVEQTQSFAYREQQFHQADRRDVRDEDIIEGDYHEIHDGKHEIRSDKTLPKD